MTFQPVRIEEIVDNEGGPGSEPESEENAKAHPDELVPSTSCATPRKKQCEAACALSAVRSSAFPQPLVEQVLEKANPEHGEGTPGTEEAHIRRTLEQLKVGVGICGRNRKEVGEHKFWATQPVPQPAEDPTVDDGCIEPAKQRGQVRREPYPLLKDFQWCTIDVNDPSILKEVYELLSANYVENDNAAFRFHYTQEFLEWALKPPGYHPEWHIGVRESSNKKLVAFISGVPITLRVRQNVLRACKINYLCVHRKLRSKRLAPVLIKEMTRQGHLKGIFQAIYTSNVVLPTPVSTCQYYHRSLNVPKLVDIKFTHIPRHLTLAQMIRSSKLPVVPRLACGSSGGLREMADRDVAQVGELYTRYMQRFGMAPLMTLDEIRHQFLGGKGEVDRYRYTWKGRREGQVVWAYVVEDPQSHEITDFFSFYTLPSSIVGNEKHSILEAAYLFYYATDVAFSPGAEEDGRLKKRLQDLIGDALIIADQAKFDVFNALTLMDSDNFLRHLRFGSGDGLLNYYLYNWRTATLAGVEAVGGMGIGRGIGVVML